MGSWQNFAGNKVIAMTTVGGSTVSAAWRGTWLMRNSDSNHWDIAHVADMHFQCVIKDWQSEITSRNEQHLSFCGVEYHYIH